MRLFVTLLIFTTLALIGQEKDKEPYQEVEFKTLTSFELPLEVTYFAEKDQIDLVKKAIPKKVQQLNGQKVKIKGFMVPVTYDKDYHVTGFLFAPDQNSCCFGQIPNLNGFIFSTTKKAVKNLKDKLIEVTGTLYTEPKYYNKEECVLIYKMDIDSVKKLEYRGTKKGFPF